MIQEFEHRPTQAIIDLDLLKANLKVMQDRLHPDQELYAVVKADAYGHGASQIAKTALQAGATGLLVATVDEAIQLRQDGIRDCTILVLGLTDPRGIGEILLYNVTVTVSSTSFFDQAYQQLQATDRLDLLKDHKLNFHLALDTGMGRIGLRSGQEIDSFVQELVKYDWINWEGVFTHFSTIGGGPQDYIEVQWQRWLDFMDHIPEAVTVRHYANSAMGLWQDRQPQSKLVRYGIAMYGLDPKDQYPSPDGVQPILSLVSELVYVKKIQAGEKVSYGATYTSQGEEWVATIPIGYADGWLRHYKKIPVLVDGQTCPIIGVINMDQLMIRLPKYYPIGTNVTLIGRDGQSVNHPSLMAGQLDTIGYEILTSLSKRIPRVYIEEANND